MFQWGNYETVEESPINEYLEECHEQMNVIIKTRFIENIIWEFENAHLNSNKRTNFHNIRNTKCKNIWFTKKTPYIEY